MQTFLLSFRYNILSVIIHFESSSLYFTLELHLLLLLLVLKYWYFQYLTFKLIKTITHLNTFNTLNRVTYVYKWYSSKCSFTEARIISPSVKHFKRVTLLPYSAVKIFIAVRNEFPAEEIDHKDR